MKAGRRFRVELTDAQARLAQQTADACRAVWNTGLEQRREYRRRGAWMNYEQQAHELVEAKKEHTWLTEAPSHCLQQTLRDLNEACRTHGTFKVRSRLAGYGESSKQEPAGNREVLLPQPTPGLESGGFIRPEDVNPRLRARPIA